MRALMACLAACGLVGVGRAAEPGSRSKLMVHFDVLPAEDDGENGGCGTLAMAVLTERRRPVACFGLTKVPGQRPRYSYLLLFKAAPARKKDSVETGAYREGKDAKEKDYLDFSGEMEYRGKKAMVGYKAKIDAKDKALSWEELTVGGVKVEVGGPRVYLVDLTAGEVTYVPVKVEGFIELPAGERGRAVRATIDWLRDERPEVKAFLK